jgi:hypothetical protein
MPALMMPVGRQTGEWEQQLSLLSQWAHQIATFTGEGQKEDQEGAEEQHEAEEAEEHVAQQAFVQHLYSQVSAALKVWPAIAAATFLQAMLVASANTRASASGSFAPHKLNQQRRRVCMKQTLRLVLGQHAAGVAVDDGEKHGSGGSSTEETTGLSFVQALFRCGMHTLLHCYRLQLQPANRRASREGSMDDDEHEHEADDEQLRAVVSAVLELLEIVLVAAPCAAGAFADPDYRAELQRKRRVHDGSGDSDRSTSDGYDSFGGKASYGLGSLALVFFKVVLQVPKRVVGDVDAGGGQCGAIHPALLRAVLWQYVQFHLTLLQPVPMDAVPNSAAADSGCAFASLDSLNRGWFLYSAEKRELQSKIRSFVHALGGRARTQHAQKGLEQRRPVPATTLSEQLRRHDPGLADAVLGAI